MGSKLFKMIVLVVYLQLLSLAFSTEPDFYKLENIVVCLCVLMVLPVFYQFLNDSALQALDIYQVSVNPQTGQYYLRPPRYG